MRLRDQFAIVAMQGILERVVDGTPDDFIAEQSYKVADAMMKERAKQDFSSDPDYVDFKAILSEQNNMPIVPMYDHQASDQRWKAKGFHGMRQNPNNNSNFEPYEADDFGRPIR